jgi:protein subunit release factor B
LETDLLETFKKGGGPGGQKINKTCSAVQLLHIPTGIRVETQRFRGLAENRKEARKLLLERLDQVENGSLSRKAKEIQKVQKRKQKQAYRSKKKYHEEQDKDSETRLDPPNT